MSCDDRAEQRRLQQMLSSAQTTLKADAAYIDLLEAESTWPNKYVFSQPNPVAPRRFPIMGLNAPDMGPRQVPTYNELLPQHFRVMHRAAHNKPQTELFGTAPYIALGGGVMRNVDASSMLMQGNWIGEKGSRILTEVPWERQQFVTIPCGLKQLKPELRLGAPTRVGPAYLQPHDP